MGKFNWKVGEMLQNEYFRRPAYKVKNKIVGSLDNADSCHFTWENNPMLSWQWLMTPNRMKIYLENLKQNLTTDSAIRNIVKILLRDGILTDSSFKQGVYSRYETPNDMRMWNYHRKFQFQFESIDQELDQTKFANIDNMDDLWASFGGFSLYAGIKNIEIYAPTNDYCEITIPNFKCYGADSYEFSGDNQYLGHWNKKGLRTKSADAGIAIFNQNGNNTNDPSFMHTLGYARFQDAYDVYFCVRNEHYNRYREKYGKGGEMIVWTQPNIIPIKNFIFRITKGGMITYGFSNFSAT
ncbi:MAG: hypothetical protein FNT15_07940 [Sulfurovum sp.]|nr:MAG: hypothetical protein FNT15_07940 [Sulfurovum sp.]